MYEFWYDYVKPKYGKIAKLCDMDTDSCIIYIKQIIAKILQKMLKQDLTLQIMNQNAISLRDHCLKEKIKKVVGLREDELGRKIMITFVGLRAKICS